MQHSRKTYVYTAAVRNQHAKTKHIIHLDDSSSLREQNPSSPNNAVAALRPPRPHVELRRTNSCDDPKLCHSKRTWPTRNRAPWCVLRCKRDFTKHEHVCQPNSPDARHPRSNSTQVDVCSWCEVPDWREHVAGTCCPDLLEASSASLTG